MSGALDLALLILFGPNPAKTPKRQRQLIVGDQTAEVDPGVTEAMPDEPAEKSPSEPERDDHEQHLLDTESQQQMEHLVKRLERRH